MRDGTFVGNAFSPHQGDLRVFLGVGGHCWRRLLISDLPAPTLFIVVLGRESRRNAREGSEDPSPWPFVRPTLRAQPVIVIAPAVTEKKVTASFACALSRLGSFLLALS